jgi:hypothetical protein
MRKTITSVVLTMISLMAIGGLAVSPPVAAQGSGDGGGQPSAISLGYEPGDPVETVQVLMTGAQARVLLFVMYDGTGSVNDVLFYASLRDEEGRPVTAGSLQFLDPAKSNAALGRVDLASTGGARQVVLQISDLSDYGSFSGFVGVEVGGGSTRIAGLTVERPAEPVLKIQEAGDGTEITLMTFDSELKDSFFLVETAGQVEPQPLTASASQLRAASGSLAEVTLAPSSLTLTPHLAQRVSVQGTIPEVGDYRGLLTLTYGEKQETYTLVVKRQPGLEQVTLDAIPPAPVIRLLPIQSVDARVPLDLSEAGGRQAAFRTIRLKQLIEAGSNGAGAYYESWELENLAGNTVASGTAADDAVVLTLEPAQPTQMILVIHGLTRSGQYEGTVAVTTPSGVSGSDTFTLFVKDSAILPLVVMILGALGSYGLRYWLSTGRPNAIEEADIVRMHRTIAGALPDENNTIRKELERELSDLLERNRMVVTTDVQSGLQDIAAMLDNYVVIRDALDLRSRLERLVSDEGERRSIEQQLNRIEDTLRRQRLDSLRNDAQGHNALTSQAQQIRRMLEGKAQEDIGAVMAATKALAKTLTSEMTLLSEEEQASLKPMADQVAEAEQKAKACQAAQGDEALQLAGEARAAYEKAREAYQQWAADRWRQTLEAQETPPMGFEQEGWKDLRNELLGMLDQDYDGARKLYLKRVLGALHDECQSKAEWASGRDDAKDQAGRFASLASQAQAAAIQADADPDQARVEYMKLEKAYQTVRKVLEDRGILSAMADEAGEARPAPAPGSGAGPSMAGQPLPELPESVSFPSLSRIRAEIKVKDMIALGLVSVLTSLIGLQLLWVPADGFGSLVDYIGAFLWGFGLNELNKVALPTTIAQMSLPWYPAGGPAPAGKPAATGGQEGQEGKG